MSDDFKLYNMFVRNWKQILHDLLLDDFSCVQKVLIFRITDTHTHTHNASLPALYMLIAIDGFGLSVDRSFDS